MHSMPTNSLSVSKEHNPPEEQAHAVAEVIQESRRNADLIKKSIAMNIKQWACLGVVCCLCTFFGDLYT